MPQIQIAQHSLYYELTGKGPRMLVLFNGITMSTAAWTFMLPVLENHYRVLRLDFLGQGQSSKPQKECYSLTEQANLAHALLEQLQLQTEPFYLLGLSYGGMVAQYYARQHPHQVSKLLLASTLAWADSVSTAICDSWIAAQSSGGFDLRYQISIPWLFSSRFLASHAAMLPELKKITAQADWPSMIRLINGLRQHDARTWLDTIKAPTLVLLGSEDRLTPCYQSQTLAERLPNARLELIQGAAHVLHLEAPEAFGRAITGFFPTHP
jgi:3-oxoadipate enol-lactonase